jgi:hypothetical protein
LPNASRQGHLKGDPNARTILAGLCSSLEQLPDLALILLFLEERQSSMGRRVGRKESARRGVAPQEVPEMGNIVAIPVRRGRLRLIQGGAGMASSGREGASVAGVADFETSVLIGWAKDGTHYLEVNCLTGQHLQTLINAVMELEAVILEARSKQEVSCGAPETVETTPPTSGK